MRTSLLRIWIAIGISGVVISPAEAAGVDLEKIVVTPYRIEENIQGAVDAVTVYTDKDIQNANSYTVQDFIRGTPGIDIVQTGSFGGPVSVFLRGTNSNHNQIMIDNVRMYDPIAANGAFNLAHLTLDNIERIEVVKGPQSVLYGSDAIGGVVNIITKKGSGRPHSTFSSEYGSFGTHRQALSSDGRIDGFSYSFGISHLASRGISKFRDTSEKDPYRNTALSLRADYNINEGNTIGTICRFTDASYEYDNSVGLKDDPDLIGKEKQISISNYFENRITDLWKQRLQLSFMGNYRQDINDKDFSYPVDYLRNWYLGENEQFDWQHTIQAAPWDTLICGFNWQREKGNYYYYTEYSGGSSEIHFPKVLSRTKGLYLQNLMTLNEAFRLNTGVRIDDHSYFGTRDTYKIDASYFFKSGTKLKATWGTAFKNPTLYQLHALPDPWFGGGNTNLQPEESQTFQAGFEQNALQDKLKFDLVYFRTQLKNLIDAKYNPTTWFTDRYSNVSKARVFGYECTLSFAPFKELQFNAGYTWQDTEDKTSGDELLRRPKNKYFAGVNYAPFEKLDLGLKVNSVGRRSDSSNRLLKAYTRWDLNAGYKLNQAVEAFLKAENITDVVYEEIKNYAQPGRSFFAGIKASF